MFWNSLPLDSVLFSKSCFIHILIFSTISISFLKLFHFLLYVIILFPLIFISVSQSRNLKVLRGGSSLWTPHVVLEEKNPPANTGDIRNINLIPGSGRFSGKLNSNLLHLVWRIPCTEESGGLHSTGSQRVRHDWSDLVHYTHTHFYLCYWSLLLPSRGSFEYTLVFC